MNMLLYVSAALCLTFAWTSNCAAQTNGDSIDINQITYSPYVSFIAMRTGDDMIGILQAGFGAHVVRFEAFVDALAIYVRIVRSGDQLFPGYGSTPFSGD